MGKQLGTLVLAAGCALALTSCASLHAPGTSAANAIGPTADVTAEPATSSPVPPEESTPVDESSPDDTAEPPVTAGDGARYAATVEAGLDPGALPEGFSLVGTLNTPRDAQPAQLYGTARFAEAKTDPTKDMGKVVTVRLVPTTPAARAGSSEPRPEILVEPRDDIAPGAVLYTMHDTGDQSMTIPAGDDLNIIVAANRDSADMVVPFAQAVTR